MFYQEMKREKRWSERTQFKERDKFELFQAIIDPDGSLPVTMIGAEHMRLYKRTMYGLPKGRNNKKEYSVIPLQDLIKKAQEERIPEQDRFSPRTIGNHCIQIATFINWAGKNEYHNNPKITGLLHVAKSKQDHENRDPYSRDDLTRIFAPADFLTSGLTRGQGKRQKNKAEYSRPDSGGRASRFWVPLLGLFTGARIEELSQLHLSDVVAVDREGNARSLFIPGEEQPLNPEALLEQIEAQQETLCVFICEGDNQSIKTEGSKRYVPLSPLLTRELNFLGYLASVHRQCGTPTAYDDGRVFPDLTKVSAIDTYSNAVGKWYQRYRQNVGITRGKGGGRKDFHSFRDTIAHWCDQIGEVAEKPAARYLGHVYGSMTFGVYSKDTAPHILYEDITLPFTEYARSFLDVDGLKQSRWTMTD